MRTFGWSYPPGCTGTPYDDDAQEIADMRILDALKDHDTGRWEWEKIDVCLTGKNADLDGGQVGIQYVGVANNGDVECIVHVGATFAGDDVCLNFPGDVSDDEYGEKRQEYLDNAQEIVISIQMEGEWSGDDWYLHAQEKIIVPATFCDETGEVDYKKTAADIVAAAWDSVREYLDEIDYAKIR